MIDKRPDIARCRDTADVVACVRFARAHGTEIVVRGGGHNAADLGVWDDALVIDLSLMRSTTVSGAYINFLMEEGQDRVRASYRGNYDRLAQVKHRYDPDNTFHINQNIQPAGQPGA
jgi:FAD/FMN-containing dehydrogenase